MRGFRRRSSCACASSNRAGIARRRTMPSARSAWSAGGSVAAPPFVPVCAGAGATCACELATDAGGRARPSDGDCGHSSGHRRRSWDCAAPPAPRSPADQLLPRDGTAVLRRGLLPAFGIRLRPDAACFQRRVNSRGADAERGRRAWNPPKTRNTASSTAFVMGRPGRVKTRGRVCMGLSRQSVNESQ